MTMGNPDLDDFQEVDSPKSSQDRPGQSALDQQKVEYHQWQELLQKRRLALAKDPRNVQLLNEVGEMA